MAPSRALNTRLRLRVRSMIASPTGCHYLQLRWYSEASVYGDPCTSRRLAASWRSPRRRRLLSLCSILREDRTAKGGNSRKLPEKSWQIFSLRLTLSARTHLCTSATKKTQDRPKRGSSMPALGGQQRRGQQRIQSFLPLLRALPRTWRMREPPDVSSAALPTLGQYR